VFTGQPAEFDDSCGNRRVRATVAAGQREFASSDQRTGGESDGCGAPRQRICAHWPGGRGRSHRPPCRERASSGGSPTVVLAAGDVEDPAVAAAVVGNSPVAPVNTDRGPPAGGGRRAVRVAAAALANRKGFHL